MCKGYKTDTAVKYPKHLLGGKNEQVIQCVDTVKVNNIIQPQVRMLSPALQSWLCWEPAASLSLSFLFRNGDRVLPLERRRAVW